MMDCCHTVKNSTHSDATLHKLVSAMNVTFYKVTDDKSTLSEVRETRTAAEGRRHCAAADSWHLIQPADRDNDAVTG